MIDCNLVSKTIRSFFHIFIKYETNFILLLFNLCSLISIKILFNIQSTFVMQKKVDYYECLGLTRKASHD